MFVPATRPFCSSMAGKLCASRARCSMKCWRGSSKRPLSPFYAARVSELGPSDFVQVECICGHRERLTAAILGTAGVGPPEVVGVVAGCAHFDGLTPTLRGGSGFGRGTSFGFSPCDRWSVGRSDKLGETAALDGRETMGAPAVCANAAALATTRTRLAIAAIVARRTALNAALLWSFSSSLVTVG